MQWIVSLLMVRCRIKSFGWLFPILKQQLRPNGLVELFILSPPGIPMLAVLHLVQASYTTGVFSPGGKTEIHLGYLH